MLSASRAGGRGVGEAEGDGAPLAGALSPSVLLGVAVRLGEGVPLGVREALGVMGGVPGAEGVGDAETGVALGEGVGVGLGDAVQVGVAVAVGVEDGVTVPLGDRACACLHPRKPSLGLQTESSPTRRSSFISLQQAGQRGAHAERLDDRLEPS